MRPCRFDVVRHDDRAAVVVVDLPGGETRAIFFGPDGAVIGAARKATDRPVGEKTAVRKRAGVNLVSVGRERYEIPDAVVFGK